MGAAELSQALVGAAAICISLFTFMMSTNDRRHKDDSEELHELRQKVGRLETSYDDLERRYYTVLDENLRLRRGEKV